MANVESENLKFAKQIKMAHGTQLTKNQNTLYQVEIPYDERRKLCTNPQLKNWTLLCIIISLSACVMIYSFFSTNHFLKEYKHHRLARDTAYKGKKDLICLM